MASGTKPSSSRDDYVPRHAPSRVRKRASKKATKHRRSFLRRRWWLLLLLTPLLFGLLAVGAFVYAYSQLEIPEQLPPIRTTYVYDRDGELLAKLHGAVDRTIVPLSQMSPHMLDAVIATEDSNFYEHSGVDPIGILRAAYTNLRGTDDEIQGASTITQQLVKNVYAGTYRTDEETGLREYVQPERTAQQKIREILLAIKVERELGKDKILARYLNTVYFGQGAYGIEAAAQTYFDKPAKRLTVLQAATLAGVLHAPELYDPIDRPSDNKFRRDYTLDQMVRYGYLDAQEAERLKARKCCRTVEQDVDATDRLTAPLNSEYFVDYVRQDLLSLHGSDRVYGGGLQVTTSLDLELQDAAEVAIARHLPDPGEDPAAALVSIDVRTGQILAMAGGRDWPDSKVNLATFRGGTGRQAGSAFKAFTLAAAIRNGYDLSKYWNGPSTLPVPGCPDPTSSDGVWHPTNAEGSGSGTLLSATANSVNTVFAQLIAQLGPDEVVETAHDLGIRSELPEVCAITLGSVEVNPLEMTTAYATLANRGVRNWATPYLQVRFPNDRIDDKVLEEPERVMAENDADLVTHALQAVVTSGTGRSAAIPPYPVAGKTGTANETVDAWFCGYTVQIATCVWVGFPERPIPLVNINGYSQVFGGTIPAAIWHDYMSVAMQGEEPAAFPTPSFDGYTVGPTVPVYEPPSPTAAPSPSPEPEPSEEPSPTPSPKPSPEPPPEPSPTAPPSPTKPPDPPENE